MSGPVRVATETAYVLAEGPVWDAPRERLLWVDIDPGLVLVGRLTADGTVEETERIHVDDTVGAVAVSPVGDLVVAASDRLVFRTADGALRDGPTLITDPQVRRLNDGKPDPQGRFVVGSLSLAGPSESERLLLVDGEDVVVIDDDLTLSNGLAWSADGTVLFSVDTERRTIYRRPWSPNGPAGARETFVVIEGGSPDGMTIDAEEHLWVAIWGGGEVRRYAPTGELVDRIAVPASQVSCVAFAGPDLRTLVITTSIQGLSAAQRAEHPDAGRLFTCRPGVAGRSVPVWSGLGSGASRL